MTLHPSSFINENESSKFTSVALGRVEVIQKKLNITTLVCKSLPFCLQSVVA